MKRAATLQGGTQGGRVPQTSACSRFTSDMKSQTADVKRHEGPQPRQAVDRVGVRQQPVEVNRRASLRSAMRA